MLDVESEEFMIVAKSPAKILQFIVSLGCFECLNEENLMVLLQVYFSLLVVLFGFQCLKKGLWVSNLVKCEFIFQRPDALQVDEPSEK